MRLCLAGMTCSSVSAVHSCLSSCKRVCVCVISHFSPQLESCSLSVVDVSLHTGLCSGDQHCVPQCEASQSHRHWTGAKKKTHTRRQELKINMWNAHGNNLLPRQHPQIHEALLKHSLLTGEGRWRRLIGALQTQPSLHSLSYSQLAYIHYWSKG